MQDSGRERPPAPLQRPGGLVPSPHLSRGLVEEAARYRSLIEAACPGAQTLLELGSGGGNNASHLSKHYACTLSDVSPQMLTLSQGLNPGCEHVLGDMRTMRLGRTFDVVFVHDAIAYMVTETDLLDCLATAFAHLRPGGVALFVPDHTRESFLPSTDHGGHDGADGRSLRYSSGHANRRPATRRTRWTTPCSSRSPADRPRSCTIITSRGSSRCIPGSTCSSRPASPRHGSLPASRRRRCDAAGVHRDATGLIIGLDHMRSAGRLQSRSWPIPTPSAPAPPSPSAAVSSRSSASRRCRRGTTWRGCRTPCASCSRTCCGARTGSPSPRTTSRRSPAGTPPPSPRRRSTTTPPASSCRTSRACRPSSTWPRCAPRWPTSAATRRRSTR